MLAAFATFCAALAVVVASDGVPGIDARVASSVAAHREPWLTDVFRLVTHAGEYRLLVPVLAMAGLLLWRSQGTPRALIVLAVTLGGASLLSNGLKLAVARDRPPHALEHVGTYAFPSGHSAAAAAGWLALAVVLGAGVARQARRVTLFAVAAVIIASVGISRIYLGVHWTTDVIGGWALGSLWALIVLTTATRR